MSNATLIIAEAGVNHNGRLDLALKLVDEAKRAGADAVKFQTAIPSLVATTFAGKAPYQKRTTQPAESQLRMLEKILLPLEAFRQISDYCAEQGIIFFSTAFDLTSLELLEALKQPFHKIPSGEITNLPFLREVGRCGRPVLLSTGMCNLGEVESAINAIEVAGTPRSMITALQCNTEYPTPLCDVNLRAMCTLGNAFGVQFGYSDHTEGIDVPIAAVALGASVIEKHLTLAREMPGPDHKASIEPDEFSAMVRSIRRIEEALGSSQKKPSMSELQNRLVARRSIVALTSIKAGDLFSPQNVCAKRPGGGISPMRWDEVVGRVASRDYLPDEQIAL